MRGADISRAADKWRGDLCGSISIAAVAFLAWDTCITLDDEVEWIWLKPNKFTFLKCLYLFLKYFAIVAQIINEIITAFLSGRALDEHTCKSWYSYQILTAQSLLSGVEIILMLRVYALYGQSRAIWAFLTTVIFTEFAAMVVRSPVVMRDMEWDESCLPIVEPRALMFLGAGVVTTHSIIWLLTMYKNISTRQRTGSMSPLLHLIFRDGAVVFVTMISMALGSSMHESFRNTWNRPVYSWFVSTTSTIGSRLVLNMRSVADTPETTRQTVELTSIGSQWSSTSSKADDAQ